MHLQSQRPVIGWPRRRKINIRYLAARFGKIFVPFTICFPLIQRILQHATTEKEAIGPAHCASPRWTTPNTLKYYVLLHDSARDDELKYFL